MPDIFDESAGSVTLPLVEYHRIRDMALRKLSEEELGTQRKQKVNAAAREVEEFLKFLYKNVKFNFEEYVSVFNQNTKHSQIILDEKNKTVKIKLEIDE